MKLQELDVRIKIPEVFEIGGKWAADDAQLRVAWELYVELVTRIATVGLSDDEGLLREALSSLYQLFPTTREVLKRAGPRAGRSRKKGFLSIGEISVLILNRGVRPFLARWHPELTDWEAQRPSDVTTVAHERAWPQADDVRQDLRQLRLGLSQYVGLLEAALGIQHSLMEKDSA